MAELTGYRPVQPRRSWLRFFGIGLLFQSLAGAIGIAVLIGIYALVYGVVLIGLALHLRKHAR